MVQLAEGLDAKLGDASFKAKVEKELEDLLAHVNEEVETFERLAFLAVSKKPWTIEDGQLTPTMKIKRGPIEDLFNDHLDTWYDAKKKVVWQ